MSRTRASARAAGTRFETMIARYLAEHVDEQQCGQDAVAIMTSHHNGDCSGSPCSLVEPLAICAYHAVRYARPVAPGGGVSPGHDPTRRHHPPHPSDGRNPR